MTARDKLRDAESALRFLLNSLDATRETCGSCGAPHYPNRDEFQAAQSLRGMVGKLERMAWQDWAKKELLP